MERKSGILMHITSLPGDQGCGTLGKEAFDFADFLKASGQKAWQILPTCPIGVGGSPYQSCSAMAGNPLLIDLHALVESGDLEETDLAGLKGETPERVDYAHLSEEKPKLLRKAYRSARSRLKPELERIYHEQGVWLPDYALFSSLKEELDGAEWMDWEYPIKAREQHALEYWGTRLQEQIGYYVYEQYLFLTQWEKLREYANENGIQIIGDLPIYVSQDSADVWANQMFFDLDEDFHPKKVSGVPPDAFSDHGQLWNNPLYRWDVLKEHHYRWWIDRIRSGMRLYDMVRLDHFRGFQGYWEVPRDSETAIDGHWVPGPSMDLFHAINWQLGNVPAIAEDLGVITEDVVRLREESGFPGMRVLQFAFDGNFGNPYLPHVYPENSVVYTGTHDNNTVAGWAAEQSRETLSFAREYLGIGKTANLPAALLRAAWASKAHLAIAPIQDVLGLGAEARMNTPSTVGNNWEWRIKEGALNPTVSAELLRLTQLYGRC